MKKGTKITLWSVLICLALGIAGWFGWTWYDNNVDRSGWREKNGVTIYADFHGKPATGWQEIDGSRYYFSADHALQTGWITLDGHTYYLNSDGQMQTQWLETAGSRSYFGDDGILRTGWQEIGENRYYFDAAGAMQSGWVELGGQRHYFHEDGTLAAGWTNLKDGTYYLDDQGSPTVGWLELEEGRFCFDEVGVMYTGRTELDGKQYLFSETGAAHTGWLEDNGSHYFFDASGAMATGWTDIEDSRYYFTEEGTLHTGWLQQGEYRYYLLSDGTMATGKQEIDGGTYYFSPKGIWVLLVNPWHPISGDYQVDLVEIEDGWMVDRQILEPLQAMLEAMRAEGLLPYFSSTYRNEADQQGIWQRYVQRYMDAGYDQAQANAMTAAYVAVPGTSEHHTGLAVDIVGHDYFYSGHPGSTMAVQAWLKEHCWEYGFILRYTKEKQAITGFAAETWHFRYVGTEVSMDMKDTGLCLEEYLGAHNSQ